MKYWLSLWRSIELRPNQDVPRSSQRHKRWSLRPLMCCFDSVGRPTLVILAFALVGLPACSFKVNGTSGSDDLFGSSVDDMASAVDDMTSTPDMTSAPDMPSAPDMATPNDLTPACIPLSVMCNGNNLDTCRSDGSGYDSSGCPLGCSSTGTPHCKVVVPSSPLTPADLDPTGLSSTTYAMGTSFNTATGQIGSPAIRDPNNDATKYEIHQGIGFHTIPIPSGGGRVVAVWTFKDLTVNAGSNLVFYGPNAAAIASAGNITANGVFDVSCAANLFVSGGVGTSSGPGGSAGVDSTVMNAEAPGGGNTAAQANAAGGGAGSFGDVGGNGGKQAGTNGGTAGAITIPAFLRGGYGGGAGGNTGGVGGGGGGAMYVVSGGTILVGMGSMSGGIGAGGCPGRGGGAGTGGGGGGSGGRVFVEAAVVHLASNAILAANGGGGGAGDVAATTPTGNGAIGGLNSTQAAGGQPGPNGGKGGVGGATISAGGSNGGNGVNAPGGPGGAAGGGGGGAGRILINTQSGAATIDAGAQLSPKLTDQNSNGLAMTMQGTTTIQ